jgi:hypothetical protein
MKKPLVVLLISVFIVMGIQIPFTHAQDEPENSTTLRVSPVVRYVAVDGDKDKFREDWWMEDQWTGGLESLELRHRFDKNVSLRLDARAIVPEEDYKLRVDLLKRNVGSIRVGCTEYRKYFDDSGGFFESFTIPVFELGHDMHLDIATLFLEATLDKPRWPEVLIGYEHRFKDGEKSLLEWGSVTQNDETRKMFPAFKDIDEEVYIYKIQIKHHLGPMELGDQFRYEDYSIKTTRFESERNLDTETSKSVTVSEDHSYDALFNTLQLRGYVHEKAYLSLGYLFDAVDGVTQLDMDTVPFESAFDKNWFTDSVDVEQDSHVLSLNTMVGPFSHLMFYGGFQAETLEADGDTDAVLFERNFSNEVVSPEAVIVTRKDKDGFEESIGLRYTGISHTTLYAEGKWRQEKIDLFEREEEDDALGFERFTDGDRNRERYTLGVNTSPIQRTTFTARYRRSYKDNDYDHIADTEPGYSAFITEQRFTTDELTTKVSVRLSSKLRGNLKYQLVSTDIDTSSETTPPSTVLSGNYDANIYSAGLTYTPVGEMYMTGLFSYRDARTSAFDNSVASVVTYEDDGYTFLGTAGYAITRETDIRAEYTYTRSDNFEGNSAEGLPLGVDSQRHRLLMSLSHELRAGMEITLRYGYYKYDEDSNGGTDDYEAHLAGIGWAFTW